MVGVNDGSSLPAQEISPQMPGFHRFSRSVRRSERCRHPYANTFALWVAAFLWAACHDPGPSTHDPMGTDIAIRVGTSGDYTPFSVRPTEAPADGPDFEGFSIDVAGAYAAATDRRLELVPFRWPNLRADLDAGRFDVAISGVTVRADRSTAGRFSHPLTVSGAVALVAADDPAASLAELDRPGRAVAVNAGGHLERTARALFRSARVDAIPDNGAVLGRLGRDDVTVVLTDSLEAPHWQSRRPGLRVVGPLTRDRKAAWFARGNEAEAARFDAWLLDAERAGRLGAMRARAGLPEDETARVDAALLARLDERLSLMEDVARSKWIRGAPVEVREREARVLEAAVAGVRRAAETHGVAPPSESGVRRLYAAQIEAAKAIQRRWIEAQPAATPPGAAAVEAARARLDDEIRPALIFLGDRIAELLVLVGAQDGTRPFDRDVLRQALSRHALPEPIVAELASALSEITTQ